MGGAVLCGPLDSQKCLLNPFEVFPDPVFILLHHPPQATHAVAFSLPKPLEITLSKPEEVITALVERLDANLREAFEERAAIREFDGGLPREHAEALALLDLIRQYPAKVFACWH